MPSAEDVARRAYELYEARGGEPGADLDDWLQAERELRGARNGDGSETA
jgi:outer membrane protein TolC